MQDINNLNFESNENEENNLESDLNKEIQETKSKISNNKNID